MSRRVAAAEGTVHGITFGPNSCRAAPEEDVHGLHHLCPEQLGPQAALTPCTLLLL